MQPPCTIPDPMHRMRELRESLAAKTASLCEQLARTDHNGRVAPQTDEAGE